MKELIELAKEKGFKSDFEKLPYPVGRNDQYLCMCELQKWLRDEHKIIVWIQPSAVSPNKCFYPKVDGIKNGQNLQYESSYESALLEGLKEALKYI